MADDQNSAASISRGRRDIQRYRRGAHNVSLNANARMALAQHFVRKGRTHQPPASDPIFLTVSKYHSAPLGTYRMYDAILPLSHDRADLTADPIYFYHPSAR